MARQRLRWPHPGRVPCMTASGKGGKPVRFLSGTFRGAERNGTTRLPQLGGNDPNVAEKLDGHAAQLSQVGVELAALVDGNRREHEALAMIAGEFRRLREEEQTLRRRQAESLEVAALALTRLADGQGLEAPVGVRDEGDTLRVELEKQRAELEAGHEELRQLRAANTRVTD